MGFHPYQSKSHGEAIDIPVVDQQGKADAEKRPRSRDRPLGLHEPPEQ
jgi:hypothetical protein